MQSFITVVPVGRDSALVQWKAGLQETLTSKWQRYFFGRKLQKKLNAKLKRLQQFVQIEKNIYGLSINHQKVTDTLLAVTKISDTVKPSPVVYYGLFKKLQTYIASQGAQETNYPMLNILQTGSKGYETMVAIPVNQPIRGNNAILLKRMVAGNILMTEVKGGMGAVEEGFRQMDFYMDEHAMRSPARPFQSLVTDRLAEPDTTKWVTKLYCPIL